MADKVDIFIPIYIGDYLADTADLNAEEHGAYLMILMAMWRARAALPLARLDRIARVDKSRWEEVWGVIGRFFEVADGAVTQRRLMRELEVSLEKMRRASARGRKGALARSQEQLEFEQGTGEEQAPLAVGTSEEQAPLAGKPSTSPSEDPDPPPFFSKPPDPAPARSEGHAEFGGMPPPRAPRRIAAVGAATLAFLSCFDRYPRGDGKQNAAQVWQELAECHPGGEAALARVILARFDAGMLKRHPYDGDPRYRPTFETFLSQRRWEDPDPKPEPGIELRPLPA